MWLAAHAGPGKRPRDLALLAFGAGHAVPEATVRAAFTAAIDKIVLPQEALGATDEIADAVVAAGTHATMLPARVRKIDAKLALIGAPWTAPDLLALDKGSVSEPATADDWKYVAIQVLREGGRGVDISTLGAMARSLLPAGAAAPVASRMEYGWPGNDEDAATLLTENGELATVPHVDLRDHFRELAADSPLADLRDAWQAAEQLRHWAVALCDAVERELAEGRPGPACEEWWIGSLGPSRLQLVASLRTKDAGPFDLAQTALQLVMERNYMQNLQTLTPEGNFGILQTPYLLPPPILNFYQKSEIIDAR
jgi:hypothetical protein